MTKTKKLRASKVTTEMSIGGQAITSVTWRDLYFRVGQPVTIYTVTLADGSHRDYSPSDYVQVDRANS